VLASARARRLVLRSLVGTALGLLFLVLVWRSFGHSVSWRAVHLQLLPVLLAVFGALGFLGARAWRYRVLLPSSGAGNARMLGVTSISWAIGLLVPGPSADAAFIGLARSNMGVSAARATGVSLVGRLLDVVSLAVVAALAAGLSSSAEPTGVVVGAALAGAAAALVLVASLMAGPRSLLLRQVARFPRLGPWVERMERNLAELSDRPRALLMLTTTALCRISTAVEYAALFVLVDLHLSFWQVWFALAIRSFLTAIPIQGIAGVGTSQAWWTAALVLEGIPAAQAVGASITLQVLDLIVALVVSALVAAATAGSWRRKHPDTLRTLETALSGRVAQAPTYPTRASSR
jgi:Lysylphosphatidylglycerol synthase TM region